MGISTYSAVLRRREARGILLLGLLIRIPMWAASVVLTLHIVAHLGRSYTEAGIVVTASTVATAISGPWRGRLLDRIGLRRTVGPAVLVQAVVWCIAPWTGYWLLLPFVFVAGLFMVPSFTVVRQVLISAVPEGERKSALVLDSVFIEVTFMIGPLIGVLLATYLSTPLALMICELAGVVGGVVLWVRNPPLRSEEDDHEGAHPGVRSWMSPVVVAVLAASIACTIVLTGGDVGTVAALRSMGHTGSIGWVLAVWGAGSAIGGLVYGTLRAHPPAFVLLFLLAAATLPVALAPNPAVFAVLLFVAGLFCAPTITATIDDLSRAVPARVRGEALGWHGSALTGGGAIGAPLLGAAIDHGGWSSGFVAAGAIGVVVALAGMALTGVRRPPPAEPGSGLDLESGEDLARRLAPVQGVEVQARGTAGE